jgi:hypothetical protein
MAYIWKMHVTADKFKLAFGVIPPSLEHPILYNVHHIASQNMLPTYHNLEDPERNGELYHHLKAAEGDLEQFCETTQLPDTDVPRPMRGSLRCLILRTILQHIRGPVEDQIQEVKEEDEDSDKENGGRYATDQLSDVGYATSGCAPRDGASVGDRATGPVASHLGMCKQGWVKYNPDDPRAYLVTYGVGTNEARVTRWTRTVEDEEETWIEGMEGQGG